MCIVRRLQYQCLSSSYDALKKLFPSTPLDPSYHSIQEESSSLLPTSRPRNKYATPDQFRGALDKEREKVEVFYRAKEEELHRTLTVLIDEVSGLEYRDLGTDDVIKEEDEDEVDDDDEDAAGERSEGEGLLASPKYATVPPPAAMRPKYRPKSSFFNRLAPGFLGKRRKSAFPSVDEADVLESSYPPPLGRRSSSQNNSNRLAASVSTLGTPQEESGPFSPHMKARGSVSKRRSIDGSSDEGPINSHGHDRRTSISSNSSHGEPDFWHGRRRHLSLGLVQMDGSDVPPAASKQFNSTDYEDGDGIGGGEDGRAVFVWTANNDYATVVRIGFKKRITALWLEAYALKQYVDLNMTAFEKILKKFDKNTGNKVSSL